MRSNEFNVALFKESPIERVAIVCLITDCLNSFWNCRAKLEKSLILSTNREDPDQMAPGFDPGFVGRGQREAVRLTRAWFAFLDEAARAGKKAAFVFVMGSMGASLLTFDLPMVFPEVTSLQHAVRGMSE